MYCLSSSNAVEMQFSMGNLRPYSVPCGTTTESDCIADHCVAFGGHLDACLIRTLSGNLQAIGMQP